MNEDSYTLKECIVCMQVLLIDDLESSLEQTFRWSTYQYVLSFYFFRVAILSQWWFGVSLPQLSSLFCQHIFNSWYSFISQGRDITEVKREEWHIEVSPGAKEIVHCTDVRWLPGKPWRWDGRCCSGILLSAWRIHCAAACATACRPEVPLFPPRLFGVLHPPAHGHVHHPNSTPADSY